jgi:hypothetical protein
VPRNGGKTHVQNLVELFHARGGLRNIGERRFEDASCAGSHGFLDGVIDVRNHSPSLGSSKTGLGLDVGEEVASAGANNGRTICILGAAGV